LQISTKRFEERTLDNDFDDDVITMLPVTPDVSPQKIEILALLRWKQPCYSKVAQYQYTHTAKI